MLAYLFLSNVATLTQSNSLSAIFPYVHFCLTTGQEHWHSSIAAVAVFAVKAVFTLLAAFVGIAVFTGIAEFVRLRR